MAPSPAPASTAGVVAYPPHVLGAAVAAGLLLHLGWTRHLASWPVSMALGLLVGLASAGLALWARKHFLAAGTAIHPGSPTTALVTSGPYAWTRNPLYLAQGLLVVMAAGLTNSVAVLAMLGPWVLVVQLGIIAREERYLAVTFGQSYEDYRRRVRRWF